MSPSTPPGGPSLQRILAQLLDLPPAERDGAVTRLGLSLQDERELRERLAECARTAPFLPRVDETLGQAARQAQVAAELSTLKPMLPEGKYRILGKLGEGGMGSVYKAEQLGDVRRPVAIKTLSLERASRQFMGRFEAERQALALMQHPGIATVYDAGVLRDGRPFLVMEFVPGRPITAFADDHRLGIDERLRLFQQVCDAVQHAHHKAVIHRDLKAANVLAFMQDSSPRAKVIDFGIAKAMGGERLTEKTLDTGLGGAVGTWAYMSPEQAADSPDIDTRTDVYALGVLLYELLVGALPFDFSDQSDERIRQIIKEVEPPPPALRLLQIPDAAAAAACRRETLPGLARRLGSELQWIPLKAMKKEPRERYHDPLALAADIENYLAGHALAAGPDSITYRFRKTLTRHARAAAAGGVILLVLTGGIAGTSAGMIRARKWARQEGEARTLLEQQKSRALREKELAERRFDDLRELASRFLFDFDGAIANLPGSTPARQMIVRTALEYLRKLAAQSPDDPALLRDIGQSYLKVGDIQGLPAVPNLGNTTAAMESYAQAMRIAVQLAGSAPQNLQYQRDLALVHERTGDMHLVAGKTDRAMESYTRSLEIRRRQAEQYPGDARYQTPLATALSKVADAFLASGDNAAALSRYRAALEIDQKWGEPESSLSLRAVLHEKIGDVLLATGDVPGALQSQERGLTLRRQAAGALPLNAARKRDVAVSAEKVGDMLLELGRIEEARRSYAESNRISQELADADPFNVNARRDLAVGLEKDGDLLAAIRNFGEALVSHRKALALREKLAADDPTRAELQRDLAVSHERVGEMLVALKDPTGAREHYEASLAIARKLAAEAPHNARYRRDLVVALQGMGGVLEACNDAAEALKHHAESLSVAQELARAEPDNPRHQHEVAICQIMTAALQRTTGDAPAALVGNRKALEIAERLSGAAPSNGGAAHLLSLCHFEMGLSCLALGRAPAAPRDERLEHLRWAADEFKMADRMLAKAQELGFAIPSLPEGSPRDAVQEKLREVEAAISALEAPAPE